MIFDKSNNGRFHGVAEAIIADSSGRWSQHQRSNIVVVVGEYSSRIFGSRFREVFRGERKTRQRKEKKRDEQLDKNGSRHRLLFMAFLEPVQAIMRFEVDEGS